MTWAGFWAAFLIVGLSTFAVVAIAVTIGGFRDLRRMFAQMEVERRERE